MSRTGEKIILTDVDGLPINPATSDNQTNGEQKTIIVDSTGVEKYMDSNGIGLNSDFLTQVKLGNVPGHKLIHKFGHNRAVPTSPVPIATGGVYQTPTANANLEWVSDDANDSSAGTGAQKVIIQGLVEVDGDFVDQEEEVTTNGF